MEQTSAEIDNIRVEKQKELAELVQTQSIVMQEYGDISIEIAKLELKRQEVRQILIKSRARIKILTIEIDGLKSKFFSARHSGL